MWMGIFVCLMSISSIANARQVEFDDREVSISIKYEVTDPRSGPNPTFLRFPRAVSRVDNATKFVIKPATASGAEADYREIEIRPRFSTGMQKVEVLLNDGAVVRLKIGITEDARTPTSYDFEPKRVMEEVKESNGSGQISELSVFRSVLEGATPAGMSRSNYERSVNCRTPSLSGFLKRTFESEQFKVYQIELINASSTREYRIREESIILKGQDLSRSPLFHVSSRTLAPRGKGQNRSTLTILSSPHVSISNANICDLGEQIELVQAIREEARRK